MIAIDEVDVGDAGRSEEHGIARRLAGEGMGAGIDPAEIGFGLDHAADEQLALIAAHHQLSQQLARDDGGIAVEEAGRERLLLPGGYAG